MSNDTTAEREIGKAERLTREGFERLTAVQAERLITRRFKLFSDQGFSWDVALRLAVRPD